MDCLLYIIFMNNHCSQKNRSTENKRHRIFMINQKIDARFITLGLIGAATILLMNWRGYPLKLADVIFAAAGLTLFASAKARQAIKMFWPKLRPYALSFAFIVFFIIIAQITSYFRGYNTSLNSAVILNYARVIFNFLLFLFLAFLVIYEKRALRFLSYGVLISPFWTIPVFWPTGRIIYLSGGRLTGFVQSPIIFGLWMAVVYLIGLGIILDAKRKFTKILLLGWLVIVANFILWAASRASWLSLSAAILFWLLFYLFYLKNFKKAAAVFFIVLFTFSIGYFLLPKIEILNLNIKNVVAERAVNFLTQPSKEQSRTKAWRLASWQLIGPAAGLGFGFGDYLTAYLGKIKTTEDINLPHSANNFFIETALDGGLGALAAIIFFFLKLGRDIKRALARIAERDFSSLTLAWFIAVPAVVIDVFFTDGFLLRHVWFVLGTGAGAALSIGKFSEKIPDAAS